MMQDLGQLIVLFFVYYFLNYFLGKNIYNQEIFQSIISIIPFALYKLIKFILRFIKRPLNINIDINDFLSKKKKSITISHFSSSQEKERKFSVKIILDKNLSLWNRFAMKYVKNRNISLLIEMNPSYSQFVLTPSSPTIPINRIDRGNYEINISNMVESALNVDGEFFQIIDFIVNENRDNRPTNSLNFVVAGYILIDGKKYEEANIIKRSLIKIKNSEGSNFKVEYYI